MLNTILFDLDGTLLSLDTDKFIKKYFDELSLKLKDYFSKDEFIKLLWEATLIMINSDDGSKTNAEVFFEYFFSQTEHEPEILHPIFDDFYEKEFLRIKEVTEKNEYIIKSVDLLKEKGYDLIIATNPIFPRLAVYHRIEWAGLNKDDFKLITTYEDMHFCKPNINYYKEILEKADLNPQESMMVGNDVQEDMIANKLGLRTYLIEDNMIQRGEDMSDVDHMGSYEDFYNFVLDMPRVE
ncbi:MAG: HAD family hydrolase [Clostridiales bacterium]|nr:HAD family hydrolase [Clostridiales bacterium]